MRLNLQGQLGDGCEPSGSDSSGPAACQDKFTTVAVTGLTGAVVDLGLGGTEALPTVGIDASLSHTCAIVESSAGAGQGTVYCWGSNAMAQLGLGDVHSAAPVAVDALP